MKRNDGYHIEEALRQMYEKKEQINESVENKEEFFKETEGQKKLNTINESYSVMIKEEFLGSIDGEINNLMNNLYRLYESKSKEAEEILINAKEEIINKIRSVKEELDNLK